MGHNQQETWEAYQSPDHFLQKQHFGEHNYWVACVGKGTEKELAALSEENDHYRHLDRSVLFALDVARKAVEQAGWEQGSYFGVNFGSSRGATSLFEQFHKDFLHQKTTVTRTSPNTTLGNISSWVAHDLQTQGPEISHSITCSTALHALLNGVAWIKSGMTDQFLIGGSEAAVTPFTLAQMHALKIYAGGEGPYPCRALDAEKTFNSMVIGEGAGALCLEKATSKKALAVISGIGYATEPLEHNVSLSADALCFQRSMKMALNGRDPREIDVVVMHAPGTLKGDRAEHQAIRKVFGSYQPALTTNKWKIGHTFGASGMLSIEMAIMMMEHQQFITVPYIKEVSLPKRIKNVMVNAVGFGGNAVSVLLKHPRID